MIQPFIRRNSFFLFLIFFILTVLYFPQLTGDFIGDDIGRIKDVPTDRFFPVLYKFLGDRPLLVFSMWFDRAFLGLEEFGMKLENLFIVALVFLSARVLINRVAIYFNLEINSLFRDLILIFFAIHPLNTQAFGHVIQRGALLATLFGFFSTWAILYSKGNPGRLSWKLGLLTWCLALMAKPNIAFLPIWWALILWMGGDKKKIPYLIIYLLMLFIPYVGYFWGGFNPQSGFDSLSPWEYFLTQGRVILVYFKLLVWPDPLYFIYHFKNSAADELFPGLVLWLVYLAVFIFSFFKIKNNGFRVFALGSLLAFLPESSFFRIIHVIFEHRTFTPFLMLLASLSFLKPRIEKKILVGVFSLVFLIYGSLTFKRSLVVQNYDSWALHDLKQGDCEIPYNVFYVAHQFLRRGNIPAAKEALTVSNSCTNAAFVKAIIEAEIELLNSETITSEVFANYKNVLHSLNKVACIVRNQSNLFFIERSLKIDKARSACLTEDLLSHQLSFMINHPFDCSASIEYYVLSSNACMKDLMKDPEVNLFRLLKLRTIRFYYFDQADSRLGSDLDKAKHLPGTKYLLEMYDRKIDESMKR